MSQRLAGLVVVCTPAGKTLFSFYLIHLSVGLLVFVACSLFCESLQYDHCLQRSVAGFFVLPATMGGHPARSQREVPLCVLVAGWKTQQFMSALAYEMDRGQSQLPRGSHVTFFNEHAVECLEQVEETVRCDSRLVFTLQAVPCYSCAQIGNVVLSYCL